MWYKELSKITDFWNFLGGRFCEGGGMTSSEEIRQLPRLSKDFFLRNPDMVARTLLGKVLIRDFDDGTQAAGRITETEAYCSKDPASHSFSGPTKRNAPMYGPGGTAYIYLIYGIHHCFNVVTGPPGEGSAVLIRSLLPLTGVEQMFRHRYSTKNGGGLPRGKIRSLCDGPGKICRALALDLSHNGIDLSKSPLRLGSDGLTIGSENVQITPRIGITKGADRLRRYLWSNEMVLS